MSYIYTKMDTGEVVAKDEWVEDDNLIFMCYTENGLDFDEIKAKLSIKPDDELKELIRMRDTNEHPEMMKWIVKRIKELEEYLAGFEY